MKCCHGRTIPLKRICGRWMSACDCDEHSDTIDARKCAHCGHWLSLGPANITPEVDVEIRAAEIAAEVDEMTEWWLWVGKNSTLDENCGWRVGDNGMLVATRGYLAGYLARCIATHEEP